MPSTLDAILTRPLSELASASAANPFDCVVAGGGTTGLTMASEIARNGRRVALIEAGGCTLSGHALNSELRYDGLLVRSLQRRLEYSPAFGAGGTFGSFVSCMGGRGLFWNGSAPRFQDFDFKDWPLSLTDLIEPYARAEEMFRVNTRLGDGPLARRFLRMLRGGGIPAVPGPFAADVRSSTEGIVGGTVGNGLAILARSGALTTAPESPLKLAANSLVHEVLLNSSRDTARGVGVIDREDNTRYEVMGRSVVLAAGAFESGRIALSSAISDPDHLMGTRIAEHMFCRANYPVPPDYYDTMPEVALLHVPADASSQHQLELQAPGPRVFRVRSEKDWNPQATADYAAMVRSFGSVQVTSEHHLEVTDSTKLGGYTVHMNRSTGDLALQARMQESLEKLRALLNLGTAQVEVRPPGSSYHECGGLWMGADAKNSITDATGAFHRVPNLVSGDAANWPSLAAANPHLTLLALALFKAGHLLKKLT
jgi:choline dehydrogenase-like flavoprotein